METTPNKFKLVFFPFLVAAVAFIGGYTLLHWILIVTGKPLPEDRIMNLWGPIVLVLVPVLLLRPRAKLLTVRGDNGRFLKGFLLMIGVALVFPTIVLQSYLVTTTDKLTALHDIKEINQQPATHYYTIQQYFVYKPQASATNTAMASGRYNNDLDYLIYVTVPVYNQAADTSSAKPIAWLGVKYTKTLSAHLSDDERKQAFIAFAKKVEADFDTVSFAHIPTFELARLDIDTRTFRAAIAENKSVSIPDGKILMPSDTPFVQHGGNKLLLFWVLTAIGIGIIWVVVRFAIFNEKELEASHYQQDNILYRMRFFLWPRKRFAITPLLINLNVLIYIIMVCCGLGFMTFDSDDLLRWGANYGPYVLHGQPWRLFTSTFLHGGLIHILSNMYALMFAGVLLEPVLGTKRYLALYLITGIVASATSVYIHPTTVSIGASGAIFGLYGAVLTFLLVKLPSQHLNRVALSSILYFVCFNLFFGLIPGIDNAAHVGGLVSGMLIGFMFLPGLKKEARLRDEDPQQPQ